MQPTCFDGYVHKFRLEACEEATADSSAPEPAVASTPGITELLAKLALSALVLSGLVVAAARALGH